MVTVHLTDTTFITPVLDYLPLVEEKMLSQAHGLRPELESAVQHLILAGGKRIRPIVTLLVGKMLGGRLDGLVTLSAAIEMLHTATLVHDDLIDGSLLRRGNPTLNAKWSPAATVLTGDYMFACAADLAAETGSVDVMSLFGRTLITIVNGEITQLFSSRGTASRENYDRRIYAKTASLFETTATSAALLSKAPLDAQQAAGRYGHDIGIAFQIVDDVLDFAGEQTTVGKPLGSDLRQGLITLPALYYLAMYPDDPHLHAVQNGKRLSDETINRLVEDIRTSGAVEQAMDEASHFVKSAITNLSELPPSPEHQALEELARYIVERDL